MLRDACRCAGGGEPVATTKAFQQFGDSSEYFLAPSGGLESVVRWALTKASVVSGNESFFLNGKSDSRSLAIAPGGQALSPQFCVDTSRTGFRFFAQQAASYSAPDLLVSIRWVGPDGLVRLIRVDRLAGSAPTSTSPSSAPPRSRRCCCSSTSTASRPITTPSATWPATSC